MNRGRYQGLCLLSKIRISLEKCRVKWPVPGERSYGNWSRDVWSAGNVLYLTLAYRKLAIPKTLFEILLF